MLHDLRRGTVTNAAIDGDRRYLMALYYGYGRQDQLIAHGNDWSVEPINFAEFYAAQWADYASGRSSSMHAVQDAWEIYRRSLK